MGDTHEKHTGSGGRSLPKGLVSHIHLDKIFTQFSVFFLQKRSFQNNSVGFCFIIMEIHINLILSKHTQQTIKYKHKLVNSLNTYISKSVIFSKHCCSKKYDLSFASTSSGSLVYVALYFVYHKYHQHNEELHLKYYVCIELFTEYVCSVLNLCVSNPL